MWILQWFNYRERKKKLNYDITENQPIQFDTAIYNSETHENNTNIELLILEHCTAKAWHCNTDTARTRGVQAECNSFIVQTTKWVEIGTPVRRFWSIDCKWILIWYRLIITLNYTNYFPYPTECLQFRIFSFGFTWFIWAHQKFSQTSTWYQRHNGTYDLRRNWTTEPRSAICEWFRCMRIDIYQMHNLFFFFLFKINVHILFGIDPRLIKYFFRRILHQTT